MSIESYRQLCRAGDGLEAVVSMFDCPPGCEMPAAGEGRRCRRPAGWRVNLHGCEAVLMCGQHKAAWLRQTRAQFYTGPARCAHCGCVFDDLATAVRLVRL
ncbi:hypothetical protein [Mycobacterium heckeshornense]|uniref:Uncharacterized protein n=1 Tax=Mycobacterium heckeshornense TaxID=110505 RepID=A0A7R7GVM9_9MYCO|nr:hypothetical protein [Mycobacterium heckeshornense]BCO36714.1 hypothetical protein MHEC_31470 [Mycobacterium heckeshornense]